MTLNDHVSWLAPPKITGYLGLLIYQILDFHLANSLFQMLFLKTISKRMPIPWRWFITFSSRGILLFHHEPVHAMGQSDLTCLSREKARGL